MPEKTTTIALPPLYEAHLRNIVSWCFFRAELESDETIIAAYSDCAEFLSDALATFGAIETILKNKGKGG